MSVYEQVKAALQDIVAPELRSLQTEIKRLDEKIDTKFDSLEKSLNSRMDSMERELKITIDIRERLTALEAEFGA